MSFCICCELTWIDFKTNNIHVAVFFMLMEEKPSRNNMFRTMLFYNVISIIQFCMDVVGGSSFGGC